MFSRSAKIIHSRRNRLIGLSAFEISFNKSIRHKFSLWWSNFIKLDFKCCIAAKLLHQTFLCYIEKITQLMLGNSTFPLLDYITLNRRSGQCSLLFRNSGTTAKFRENIFSSTWSSYGIGSERVWELCTLKTSFLPLSILFLSLTSHIPSR